MKLSNLKLRIENSIKYTENLIKKLFSLLRKKFPKVAHMFPLFYPYFWVSWWRQLPSSYDYKNLLLYTFIFWKAQVSIRESSNLYRISRMGRGPGSNGGGGTFWHWRNQKVRDFSNLKIFKKCLNNQWKICNFLKFSNDILRVSEKY